MQDNLKQLYLFSKFFWKGNIRHIYSTLYQVLILVNRRPDKKSGQDPNHAVEIKGIIQESCKTRKYDHLLISSSLSLKPSPLLSNIAPAITCNGPYFPAHILMISLSFCHSPEETYENVLYNIGYHTMAECTIIKKNSKCVAGQR